MNLRHAAAAAALLLLALPSAAYAGGGAFDSAGPSGQLINGSSLVTAVGGDVNSGGISVRFADSTVALFYYDGIGVDPGPQGAPGAFAVHEAGTAYSEEGTAFTPVSAPAPAGHGTVASPWTVSSAFATPDLGITQQIAHVDGSRILKMTWTVTNTSGVTVPSRRSGAQTSTSPAATAAGVRSSRAAPASSRASRSTAPRSGSSSSPRGRATSRAATTRPPACPGTRRPATPTPPART